MNKATDIFKRTIQTYLVKRAASDELFAEKYANPDKTVDDCVTYYENTHIMISSPPYL